MTQIEQLEKEIEATENQLKEFEGNKERYTEPLNKLCNMENATWQECLYNASPIGVAKFIAIAKFIKEISEEAES